MRIEPARTLVVMTLVALLQAQDPWIEGPDESEFELLPHRELLFVVRVCANQSHDLNPRVEITVDQNNPEIYHAGNYPNYTIAQRQGYSAGENRWKNGFVACNETLFRLLNNPDLNIRHIQILYKVQNYTHHLRPVISNGARHFNITFVQMLITTTGQMDGHIPPSTGEVTTTEGHTTSTTRREERTTKDLTTSTTREENTAETTTGEESTTPEPTNLPITSSLKDTIIGSSTALSILVVVVVVVVALILLALRYAARRRSRIESEDDQSNEKEVIETSQDRQFLYGEVKKKEAGEMPKDDPYSDNW